MLSTEISEVRLDFCAMVGGLDASGSTNDITIVVPSNESRNDAINYITQERKAKHAQFFASCPPKIIIHASQTWGFAPASSGPSGTSL